MLIFGSICRHWSRTGLFRTILSVLIWARIFWGRTIFSSVLWLNCCAPRRLVREKSSGRGCTGKFTRSSALQISLWIPLTRSGSVRRKPISFSETGWRCSLIPGSRLCWNRTICLSRQGPDLRVPLRKTGKSTGHCPGRSSRMLYAKCSFRSWRKKSMKGFCLAS